MERMDSTISSVVPLLLKNKPSSKNINIGSICVKLLDCLRAVHETKNIVRDVKTENFMLTLASKASGSSLEAKLASRIRLIDLAMATQWNRMYYEVDTGEMIGTPLYASLNLHSGKKTSFRDDLESLGYVIAELLTQLYSGDPSKQLPWSKGRSDEDIGSMKESLVDDTKSQFYRQLGDAKTIAVFSEYMEIVRGYGFKTIPDYDELSEILSKLTVPRKKAKNASSGRSASSSKKSASTKRTRGAASKSQSDLASPSKVARRNTRTRSATSMDIDSSDKPSSNGLDESFDETVYVDAHQDLQEMDWEYCVDENEEPQEKPKPRSRRQRTTRSGNVDEEETKPQGKTRSLRNTPYRRQRTTRSGKAMEEIIMIDDDSQDEKESRNTPATRLKRRGVSITCIEGPLRGDSYDIEAGMNEIIVIGSKPRPSPSTGQFLCLKKDKDILATHVRLELSINRKVTALKVTDKSKGKTFVNRHAVTSTKAFINDIIKIGGSSFKIKTL